MANMNENTLEQTTLDWFESLGWQTAFGPNISPDLPAPGAAPVCVRACTGRRQAGVPDAEKFILEAGI